MTSAPPSPDPAAIRRGRIMIVVAALLWSISGAVVKSGAFDDWPAAHRGIMLSFWRATFVALFMAPFVRQPRFHWKLVPLVTSFTLMNVCYLTAMTLTSAANAIWLQYLAPVWVCLFAWLVYKQVPRRPDLIAIVSCAVGIGLILACEVLLGGETSSSGSSADANLLGVGLALLCGVLYAGVILSLHALRGENPVWVIAVNHAAAAMLLCPYVIIFGVWPSWTQLGILAAFGVVQMGIPYLLFLKALRHVSTQEGSLLGLLEPIFVPVWVLVILGQRETQWWTIAGAGLILLGLLARMLPRRRAAIYDSPQADAGETPPPAVKSLTADAEFSAEPEQSVAAPPSV